MVYVPEAAAEPVLVLAVAECKNNVNDLAHGFSVRTKATEIRSVLYLKRTQLRLLLAQNSFMKPLRDL